MRNSVRDNTIEEIKNRCNIVDVIGRVVTLKKAGSNYKGRCPFHNEKTPSFVVSEEKQIFTCFGCGATGDVIGFVQKYYSLDFGEAISKLAEECGVVLENHYDRNEKKDEYYEINRAAARFFYRALRETQNKGLAYVEKRGLSRDTLQKFGIGYADPKWDSLYNHLTGLGFSKEKLLELGLISLSKGKYYDKFRDRVIFPIQNTGGKVIGFGGRALGEDGP
ncbi:MAG: CHC2 zinc finger domain-containing protein, partial [Anaerovoracaceae bacterium]